MKIEIRLRINLLQIMHVSMKCNIKSQKTAKTIH